jgi:hypothetical protein
MTEINLDKLLGHEECEGCIDCLGFDVILTRDQFKAMLNKQKELEQTVKNIKQEFETYKCENGDCECEFECVNKGYY